MVKAEKDKELIRNQGTKFRGVIGNGARINRKTKTRDIARKRKRQ